MIWVGGKNLHGKWYEDACGGAFGALFAFLLACSRRRNRTCQLPWTSLTAAFLTVLPLLLIGQIDAADRVLGLCVKALVVSPIIAIGGLAGFVVPFGLLKKWNLGGWRMVWRARSNL